MERFILAEEMVKLGRVSIEHRAIRAQQSRSTLISQFCTVKLWIVI